MTCAAVGLGSGFDGLPLALIATGTRSTATALKTDSSSHTIRNVDMFTAGAQPLNVVSLAIECVTVTLWTWRNSQPAMELTSVTHVVHSPSYNEGWAILDAQTIMSHLAASQRCLR